MMRYLLIIILLAGCDPYVAEDPSSDYVKAKYENNTLVQNPVCLFVCIPSLDNIGRTTAAGVDNFTGQTSTRTTTNTGGTRN